MFDEAAGPFTVRYADNQSRELVDEGISFSYLENIVSLEAAVRAARHHLETCRAQGGELRPFVVVDRLGNAKGLDAFESRFE